jgi:molybdate transport system substrate-binding protein
MVRAFFVAALLVALPFATRAAGTVAIAAAGNFVYALDALEAEFRKTAPATVVTTAVGASGSLFAQIQNGAPFDVFLSADTDYPRRLVAAGHGDAASLRTFATGRLVLWTLRPDLDLRDLLTVVRDPSVRKIALTQPATAPYGRAAQVALEQLGAWPAAQPKVVLGENVTQTAQFVATGNADVGFVALALVRAPALANRGRWVDVPPALHASVTLDHAAVLTTRGAANPAARAFLEFLAGDAARKILRDFGYVVPTGRTAPARVER